jgi:hypothetical protein
MVSKFVFVFNTPKCLTVLLNDPETPKAFQMLSSTPMKPTNTLADPFKKVYGFKKYNDIGNPEKPEDLGDTQAFRATDSNPRFTRGKPKIQREVERSDGGGFITRSTNQGDAGRNLTKWNQDPTNQETQQTK